ncbi:uncharacterized protein G2W53_036061 [Senna tora]|uniref:Uncharacterized protein n=1 Tax=Senna tora TaxID=362788 RepID=A0A834SRW8_9FABA|nr:uncharacterized protein G2W53_036061 [Senna tora]
MEEARVSHAPPILTYSLPVLSCIRFLCDEDDEREGR